MSKPEGSDRISPGTLSYFQIRNRQRIYGLVINAFKESGVSQADLAKRLGKGTDQVCRWLGAPGNWGLDTVSDLLFAINGGEPDYSISHPLEKPKRNMNKPAWAEAVFPVLNISRAETVMIREQPNVIRINGGKTWPDQQN